MLDKKSDAANGSENEEEDTAVPPTDEAGNERLPF